MKPGTLVTYTPPEGHHYPKGLTKGKAYAVVEYDRNDTGWPDGCSGTPFITIENDRGEPFMGFAYRFKETAQ